MTNHREVFPPVFATNNAESGETVAEAINRLFRKSREELKVAPSIAIATAYLNPGGFLAIADEIESAPRVRILLGADPQEDIVESAEMGTSDHEQRLKHALQEHIKWLEEERNMLGFTRESSEAAQRLVAWLRHAAATGDPIVEIRQYNKGFLHGKAFIVDHETYPAVLAGSSNMTYAGLMRNAELNLGYSAGDREHTKLVQDWFEKYWEQSEEFDLAALYEARWQEHSPWIVFLRMLWEQYKDHLEEDSALATSTELKLTQFQSDGVSRMLRLLDEHGGVLVADEVGLGKTFLAGEVIARASERERQKVLIVCPASLRDSMWNKFLKKYDLSRRIDVMSYEELRNQMDPEHPEYQAFLLQMDDYSLVVVDEAHNLRNEAAARSKAVDALVGGANPKKTILLTATPVNNSLSDLETLVRYFIRSDSYFAPIGIPSISKYIKRAQSIDPDSLSPRMLFDLMDQVAVRRTRRFVKDNYPNDRITLPSGEETVIVFPTPRVYRINYRLDEQGEKLLNRVVEGLEIDEVNGMLRKDNPNRLLLSRYTPSGYRTDREIVEYQLSNAQLLRSGLLKRLESSPRALYSTLGVMIKSHQEFLKALDAGWVLSGDALREWAGTDSEDLEALLETFDDRKKSQVDHASEYFVEELKTDVARDLKLLGELRELADEAANGHEPKVEELVEQLRQIALDARKVSKEGLSAEDRRKVIVFSAYADTVQDLYKHVKEAIDAAPDSDALSDYKGRLPEAIAGRGDRINRAQILSQFAPRTSGEVSNSGEPLSPNNYDILITTDVLAEGVNLQQAGRMINYDLPWNPMRIVQRHGRIDRIGSEHSSVYLGCFFPAEKLNDLLRLERTLMRKIAYAAASIGIGEVIPDQTSKYELTFADAMRLDQDLDENEEYIRQLADGNAHLLETRGEGSALSGEEYRRRLSTAMAETFTKPEVLALPYASGSGFVNPNVNQSGYVWCMKMGNSDRVWFAWTPVDENWNVLMDPDSGLPVVDRDVLTALVSADPGGPEMFRELSDEVFNSAYDAWQVAQDSTFESWTKLTDPQALMPELVPAMRRAIDFVLSYSGEELTVPEKQLLIAKLNTTPRVSTRRELNSILNSELSDKLKLKALQEEVDSAGLIPVRAPKGLDRITKDEVRLVAWMAVKAGK